MQIFLCLFNQLSQSGIDEVLIFVVVIKQKVSELIIVGDEVLVGDDKQMFGVIKHMSNKPEVLRLHVSFGWKFFKVLQEISELAFDITGDEAFFSARAGVHVLM